MSDLISRADAVRLLVERYKFTTSKATEILSALPSAEASQNLAEPNKELKGSGLIRREDAIEAIEFGITYARAINKETGAVKELFQECNGELKKAVERVNALPSAEAVQGWVPCSERLPSESGRYIVTYPLFNRGDKWDKWLNIMNFGKPSMPNIKVKGKCWYMPDDEYGDVVWDDVVAWMPLPEPYKGGEDE